jgi:hypothetical protein
LMIFQKNKKIPLVCVGNCGNLWWFLFTKKENYDRILFFQNSFHKMAKISPKKITHSACFVIIRGFVNSLSPQIFSGVGSPYVSLCFFTPQASPARVTIALGAFHWWHPISSAYPTSSLCNLETSRPTMLEPWRSRLSMKEGSLFCSYEIHWTGMLQILFLMSLESSRQGGVHGLGSMAFGLAV